MIANSLRWSYSVDLIIWNITKKFRQEDGLHPSNVATILEALLPMAIKRFR